MSRIITFSREYPKYHPKAGQPTYFVEKFYNSLGDIIPRRKCGYYYIQSCGLNPNLDNGTKLRFYDSVKSEITDCKHTTIRAGHRWKVGDKFSPRVWSGKPYNSKQITIAPDIEVVKVWDFELTASLWWDECRAKINGLNIELYEFEQLSYNDGLSAKDMLLWLAGPNLADSKRKPFNGQIICWNPNINY